MFHLIIDWLYFYEYGCLCENWKRNEFEGAQGMKYGWKTMFVYGEILNHSSDAM